MTTFAYRNWILDLRKRYKATQCKAAVAVNSAMLEFYWNLGKDISEKYPGKRRNVAFFAKLSQDLVRDIGNAKGISERNLHYALSFYDLYAPYLPQVVADKCEGLSCRPRLVDDKNLQQLVEQLVSGVNIQSRSAARRRTSICCSISCRFIVIS